MPSAPAGRSGPAEPARTETERVLAAMLAEALEVPEVGRNDNFFSLGGDSILAVQLAARARDAGIPLTARMVFEHPAIHDLAATVDNADSVPEDADAHHEPMAASGLSADELAAVTSMFAALARRRAVTATEAKVAVEDVMALSPLQQGLFSLSKLSSGDDGADDPYVIAMSADIVGVFDPELLRECAAALLARHPNLRASFFHGDLSRPVQVVPTRVDVPWRTVTATADEVDALDADERRRPFDLERGPAIRFLIIEVPESHWRFVVVAHHILLDGWSLATVRRRADHVVPRRRGRQRAATASAALPRLHRLARRAGPGSQSAAVAGTPRRPRRSDVGDAFAHRR